MSPTYDQPRRYQNGPEDLAGILVLLCCAVAAFCWYVAVSRLHLRNGQCLEIFMNCAIFFFGGGFVIAQLVGRRRKREENWPHPPVFVTGSAKQRFNSTHHFTRIAIDECIGDDVLTEITAKLADKLRSLAYSKTS